MTASSDRLAVITGASSGIGAATALRLARDGWQLVLVARQRAALEGVARRVVDAGGGAIVEALDAADGDQVVAMAERVRGRLGVPRLIVNSAGAGAWRFTEDTAPDEAKQMMAAPYLAAFNTCHAFMADMLAQRSGVLIHVGSPASRVPWPGATGYTAARWALRGLHEALRQDLRGTGLRSCHVVFGEVSSAYFAHNQIPREHLPKLGRVVPVLTPERCAEIIVRAAHRPRHQVVAPLALRLMYWCAAVAPGPVSWLVAASGRHH